MIVLYLIATDTEYGPYLRARINAEIIGVGPVEAAVNATRILAGCHDTLPELVVLLGSAGSQRLQQCGIYQASSVSYRDMDASVLGFAKGQTPFLDVPITVPLCTIDGLPSATLSTGGNVVSGGGYDSIAAEMVDMETYAVMRACHKFGVKLLSVRGISDGDAELGGIGDWTNYLDVIDQKLAAAVNLIEVGVRTGQI